MKYFELSAYYNNFDLDKFEKKFPHFDKKIKALEKIQNYEYKNKKIAIIALLHGSALVHWPHNKSGLFSNEKFEFLGDSFLNFFVASYAMSLLPDLSEGDYSKLRAQIVGETNLALKSRAMNLSDCVIFGKSQQNVADMNQDSILADAFEAITAALFLDGGLAEVSNWLAQIFETDIHEFSKNIAEIDVKGLVQHWIQKEKGVLPVYVAKDCTKDLRFPKFEVSLLIKEEVVSIGHSNSKKDASLKAAEKTLQLIKSGELKS